MKRTGKSFNVLILTVSSTIMWLCTSGGAAAQDATVSVLRAELEKTLAENAVLKDTVARLEAQLAAEAAARDRFRAAGEAATKAVAALQQELTAMRKLVVQLQTERDKNLASVVELTDQLHQAFNEVKQLKDENARLRALVPQPPENVTNQPKLEGLVSAAPSGDLMEISVGSDAGLKEGHRLEVYRGSGGSTSHLGHALVVKTMPDKSICKVDTKSLKGPIQKGDRVVSEPAGAPAGDTPKPGELPYLVEGEVLTVREDGQVEISFGAADGLRPGHRLEVYRVTGSEGIYVGRIEVARTTAKKSVCKSILEFERHTIREGDHVTSKL